MPAIYRAMTIHSGVSGDPKDRYVNNFHFASENVQASDIVAIQGALDLFWTELNIYLPQELTREEYRVYDLADPTPREPQYAVPGTQPSGTGSALPFEVALCLSYYGQRNIRRQRGRVYIGPLVSSAAATGPDTADPIPSATLIDDAIDAAEALQAHLVANAPGLFWGVYSPTSGQIHAITDVWVDNAFDTQRRRGTAATSRVTASIPLE